MATRLLLFIALFTTAAVSNAQQKGCFFNNDTAGTQLVTDIDFSDYNLFFLGEFHGVYATPDVKLSLIKYLNKTYGITDVFVEVGHSAAWLYNSYLATGDTAFITRPRLLYTAKQPDMSFWLGLYECNKSLTHKLTIHGMDFERLEFVKVLQLLMPSGVAKPEAIKTILTLIDTMAIPEIGSLRSTPQLRGDSIYQLIRTSLDTNRQLYKTYFGDNYKMVRNILLNENTYRNFNERNDGMFQNIVKETEKEDIKKCIVIAGLAHANKSQKGSLINQLSDHKAFKHHIADITMACKDCYDWQEPQKGIQPFKAPYNYYKDTALLNSIYTKYSTSDCKYTLLPSDLITDTKVRNYSDFIILMKDQPKY